MAKKEDEMGLFGMNDAQGIEAMVADTRKQVAKPATNGAVMGRPKKNPYKADHKITFGCPRDVYRLLNKAAGDKEQPKGQIIVEALERYLTEYKG